MTFLEPPIQLAVITGGHGFDVPNFQRLFRRLSGIEAYIQTMGDFASSAQPVRDTYDVVLFYHMLQETPSDDGKPWYDSKPITALERIKETGQGMVAMHHSLLAYPNWPVWRELTGIDPTWHSYHHDQPLTLAVTPTAHPITRGLAGFEVVDETYEMGEPDPDNQILLTTSHPQCVQAQAWVRQFGKARVFSLVLGHDHTAWSNPGFENLLLRGIRWSARKEI
jgi:uncharacterized protein